MAMRSASWELSEVKFRFTAAPCGQALLGGPYGGKFFNHSGLASRANDIEAGLKRTRHAVFMRLNDYGNHAARVAERQTLVCERSHTVKFVSREQRAIPRRNPVLADFPRVLRALCGKESWAESKRLP